MPFEAARKGCFSFGVEYIMNIEALSIDDLVTLRETVSTRLQSLVEARQGELRAEADKLASLAGKTVLKPVKYVHPQDREVYGPKRTWQGRGTQPEWVKLWLKEGGTLQELCS